MFLNLTAADYKAVRPFPFILGMVKGEYESDVIEEAMGSTIIEKALVA
jgi:hypothetical protein